LFFLKRTKGIRSFLLTAEEKEPKKTVTPKAPYIEPTEKVQNVKWINSGFR